EALASFWAEDATYTHPETGDVYTGRQEILEMYKDRFADKERKKLEVQISDITFPEPNKAVELNRTKVTKPDGSVEETNYKAVFTKHNGKWLLQTVREVDTQEPPSQYEHLKDLTWLVGKWVDQDEDVDIESTNSFGKNGNFLMMHTSQNI